MTNKVLGDVLQGGMIGRGWPWLQKEIRSKSFFRTYCISCVQGLEGQEDVVEPTTRRLLTQWHADGQDARTMPLRPSSSDESQTLGVRGDYWFPHYDIAVVLDPFLLLSEAVEFPALSLKRRAKKQRSVVGLHRRSGHHHDSTPCLTTNTCGLLKRK